MTLQEYIDKRRWTMLSGIMPIKKNPDFGGFGEWWDKLGDSIGYAFKYKAFNGDECIFAFLNDHYRAGDTYRTLSVDLASKRFTQDTSRTFLAWDDEELQKFLDDHYRRY